MSISPSDPRQARHDAGAECSRASSPRRGEHPAPGAPPSSGGIGDADPGMPLEVGSDDIETVRAAISRWEAAADHAGRVIGELERRLEELESAQWFAGRREDRRDYRRGVV